MSIGKNGQKQGYKASPGSGKLAKLTGRASRALPGYLDGDARLLLATIACITLSGAAIRFGPAQGGRGLAATIYDGDDKHTIYLSDGAEFTDSLTALYEAYQDGLSEDIGQLVGLPK